jgi:hypothetical protein
LTRICTTRVCNEEDTGGISIIILSDIDAIQKEKAEVDVLEGKKQELLSEIKELERKLKGKKHTFFILL